MVANTTTRVAVFEDTNYTARFMDKSWTTPLKAEFYPCVLSYLGFEVPWMPAKYQVSTSGYLSIPLPAIK